MHTCMQAFMCTCTHKHGEEGKQKKIPPTKRGKSRILVQITNGGVTMTTPSLKSMHVPAKHY